MRIRTRQRGLAAHLYTSRGHLGETRRLAIVCPGLPYEPSREAVTGWLESSGWDVIQVQYYGTYDSDHQFSPNTAIATVVDLVRLLEDGAIRDFKLNRDVPIASSPSLVVGHSFGSWVALRTLESVALPACVVIAPSLAFGRDASQVGIVADLSRHAEYIRQALPLTFRLASADEWHRFFTTAEDTAWDTSAVKGAPVVVPLVGREDSGYDTALLESVIDDAARRLRQSPATLERLKVMEGVGHGLEDAVESPQWVNVMKSIGGAI